MKNKSKQTHILALLGFSMTLLGASAQTVSNGVATYSSNTTLPNGKRAVPSDWKEIVIKKNVTVTGRFLAEGRNTPLLIRGEDKTTSVIKGAGGAVLESQAGVYKWGNGKLTIKNLTITNQPGRGVIGWSDAPNGTFVDGCRILFSANTPHTDGFHASGTGYLLGTYINVYDDATYPTMANKINYNTMNMRRNGAPLQIGWGGQQGSGTTKDCKNNTFVAALPNAEAGSYNCGVVDWKRSKVNGDSIKLDTTGCSLSVSATVKTPPRVSFGHFNDPQYKTVNANVKLKGWTASGNQVRVYPNSTGTVGTF